MSSSPDNDERVVSLLHAYLSSEAGHDRRWAISSDELILPVEIDVGWHLDEVERVAASEVASSAEHLLRSLQVEGDESGRAVVDRPLLARLSATAADSRRDLIACWYATMAWGSGAGTNYRLHQWMRALDPGNVRDLGAVLDGCLSAVRRGDLVAAYWGSLLPGVGEAYGTKVTWVLGLAGHGTSAAPLVLDSKVWQTLRVLSWSPTGRNAAERWASYCTALDGWAAALNGRSAGWQVDGERIEQLLFDRDHGNAGGLCLRSWVLANGE